MERSKIEYPTDFLATSSCGNSFAYFFEISLRLLRTGGYLGYIVPVSSVSTDRMIPLQKMLVENSQKIKISNFDDRPGKIFAGLEHCRSSILIIKVDKNPSRAQIYTTKYQRWRTQDRESLFSEIEFTLHPSADMISGSIPKIGSSIELGVFGKILRKTCLKCHIIKKSKHTVWYHNAPQYWIRGMDVSGSLERDGAASEVSSHMKPIHLDSRKAMTIAQSVLNSSLFYWFFIKVSNCRDLTVREIGAFGVNVDEFSTDMISQLNRLNRKLMRDYKQKSKTKENRRKNGSVVRYREFYPKHSKSIIDEIDAVLAKHYGLTSSEAEFIRKFDEQFRMGADIQ